ncbi:molybdopterin-binding protein [Antarcticimicrobium sediminis]|uniref:Molybdopterin biosynthesis protein n=1 Tax=Antarcticimicrobium sediminis TaxID=2546227 RepID=A0A4R5F018_9RHOB|nr:molybdopterin-binding protein [Antarcticimicrobium sediminis]TDE40785.1 molybdopterin biosynthesis protein [Antarcticimicrobium sediminis]
MRFGPVPVFEAEGAYLAHSIKLEKVRLRKGLKLEAQHLDQIRSGGVDEVIVARLDPGDLHENTAAEQLAAALVPEPEAVGLRVTAPFTGRVNVLADGAGVVRLDVAALEAFNRVEPMITIATVPDFQQMTPGGMVATIKVISFAVSEQQIARACSVARGALRLARPVFETASLIITQVPGGPSEDKGRRVIEARLNALEIQMLDCTSVAHRGADLVPALAAAQGQMVLVLTGSATMDIDDVAPLALRQVGGRVERFGMPVDPGNLLFLGDLSGRPVIGLPGCARSPALNGVDWVLSRVACGLEVSEADIAAMGVGGLLKEIPTRPQPRAGRKAET